MRTALLLPEVELVDFAGLPDDVRRDVNAWRDALRPAFEAGVRVGEALRSASRQLGVSLPTARRKYDAVRRSGWRGLINRTLVPESPLGLSPEFTEFVKMLCEQNQRASKPAFRALIRMWQGRDPRLEQFDEYKGFPGWPNLPKGWSERNLYRHKPTKFELKVMRVGRGAASSLRPQVFSTRVGLWVGSHYMFDDLWHDNFVAVGKSLVRVLEFDALDVFSGCKFAWGTKPRMPREDGTMEGLKESNMRFLLASTLFNYGYSERGTILMAEHGTAAIREEIERVLFDSTGGMVSVRRSGMTGEEQAVAGMFAGGAKGNPRFKSPLEVLRSLIHNELAALPAQTGKDVEHRPESTAGLLKYSEEILKAASILPVERAQLLRLPLLQYHSEFVPLLGDVYRAINSRTEHRLEGWAKAGLVRTEYRLSPDAVSWLSNEDFLSLPDPSQQMLSALAQAGDARFVRSRQLSPLEVHASGSGALLRVAPFVVSEILGRDLGVERRVDRGCFAFQDLDVDPEPMRFESRIVQADGSERELKEGEIYLTFVNPFDARWLFVHDARGRYLGMSKREVRVSRSDVKALEKSFGRAAKREAEMLAPVRARHASLTREATALRRHNAEVLKGPKARSSSLPKPNEALAAATEFEPVQEEKISGEEIAGLFASENKNNQQGVDDEWINGGF